MRGYINAILLSLLALSVLSCKEDDKYEYGDFYYNLVTYRGYDVDSHFDYQAYDDSPLIRLVAKNSGELDLTEGDRVFLNYTIDEKVSDGQMNVNLKGVSKIYMDSLRVNSSGDIKDLPMDSVQLKSIWRSGDYININCNLKYTNKPRRLILVADKSTLNNEIIECYLIHDMMNETAYYWKRYYISFYIGSACFHPNCKTIRVYMNDLTYPNTKCYAVQTTE